MSELGNSYKSSIKLLKLLKFMQVLKTEKKSVDWNIFNFITVGWMNSVLVIGSKKPLEQIDLLELPYEYQSEFITKKYRRNSLKYNTLWKVLLAMVYKYYCLLVFCSIVDIAMVFFLQPLLLGQILQYLRGSNDVWFQNGWALIGAFIGTQLVSIVFGTLQMNASRRIIYICTSCMTNAPYEKLFRLSPIEYQLQSKGQLLNIIQRDHGSFPKLLTAINDLFSIIAKLTIAMWLLYLQLGSYIWICIALVFLNLGITFGSGKFLQDIFSKFYEIDDKRMNYARECFNGIRIVKLLCLEDFFYNIIEKQRQLYLDQLQKCLLFLIIPQGFSEMLPYLIPVITFSLYSQTNPLVPEVIFPSLLLFQLILEPLNIASDVVQSLSSNIASYKRLDKFMNAGEMDASSCNISKDVSDSENAVELQNVSWAYPSQDDKESFKIDGVTLTIPRGALVGVVGSVASGKSTLMAGLVGEIEKTRGDAVVYGSIAYCAQIPWILTGSVQNNILFGSEYDEKKLASAVYASGLQADLETFPNGLKTEIGENGITMSGGQKARVALARAMYSNADVYLLDDPLAALDVKVGRHVFDNGIKQVMAEKTVFLVTHQLQFVRECDYTILLDKGKVVEFGRTSELLEAKGSFSELMEKYSQEHNDTNEAEEVTEPVQTAPSEKTVDQVIKEEKRITGSVKKDIYKYYLATWGWFYPIMALCMALGLIGTNISANLLLANTSSATETPSNFILLYCILGIAPGFCRLLYVLSISFGSLQGSKMLHSAMLKSLLSAPISFFTSQPVGRILSRLSGDFQSIDWNVINVLEYMVVSMISVIVSLILIAQATWYVTIFILLICVLIFFLFQYYQKSNLELKRLESISRSPFTSKINEAATGTFTIKAYQKQNFFALEQQSAINDYLEVMFHHRSLMIWLRFRLRLCTVAVTAALLVFAELFKANAGSIGLALTYAVQLSIAVQETLVWLSRGEAEMNAIERISEYATQLEQEAPRVLPTDPLLSEWPLQGSIEIKDLQVAYPARPDHKVVDGLSFSVNPGEKVGIVGRTGSGKSTLITCLFRMIEPIGGSILIDGKDVLKMGLQTLRSSIQMIPQDPVLFNGTIRSNLDPGSIFTDEDIWSSLDQVGMKEYVMEQSDKLDEHVTHMGDNLSVGQRQLLCLARATLVKPKILVMDEATSSIDGHSNELIQKAITVNFKDTTVLSIAHRLNSIATFDKVLVLSDGKLVEYDSPAKLLQTNGSVFKEMVEATGPSNAAAILDLAIGNNR